MHEEKYHRILIHCLDTVHGTRITILQSNMFQMTQSCSVSSCWELASQVTMIKSKIKCQIQMLTCWTFLSLGSHQRSKIKVRFRGCAWSGSVHVDCCWDWVWEVTRNKISDSNANMIEVTVPLYWVFSHKDKVMSITKGQRSRSNSGLCLIWARAIISSRHL